jgi:acyl-coenzyme A thioesterase PaaI-like protein
VSDARSPHDLPHFSEHLDFRWEASDGSFTARAEVQEHLRVPGSLLPRAGVLAMYADNLGGFMCSVGFGTPAPTVDLSVHVFRRPPSPVVHLESRFLRKGRSISVAETWFTADGDDEPFATAVASHMAMGDPETTQFSLEYAERRREKPTALLDEPIAERAGIRVVGADTVELVPAPHVINGIGTLHGGMLALLTERACEVALTRDDGLEHVVTGLDIRYLASPRVGPARGVGRVLRTDERGTHCWVEVVDAGDDDRPCLHAFATTRVRPDVREER